MITKRMNGVSASALQARHWRIMLVMAASLAAWPGASVAAEPSDSDLISVLGDGRLQVAGAITVDRTARLVCFPALVNQLRGQVEYLVVHSSGKRHEAVFVTQVRPQHLHFARLLVGAPEDGGRASTELPAVGVAVTWHGHGPLVRRAADALLFPAIHDGEALVATAPSVAGDTSVTTPSIVWRYGGSQMTDRGFAADLSGSFLALQADPTSLLIGTGGPSTLLIPAADRLPAIGTPVTIELSFPAPAPAVVDPAIVSDPRNPS